MNPFIRKHAEEVTGLLSGWDRVLFRGTLRSLAVTGGMRSFLWHMDVLLKDFGTFVASATERVKAATLAAVAELNRPVEYLQSTAISKENRAREIAERDGITEGLIGVLTCVEPCHTFDIRRDRALRRLELVPRRRKCLHVYHYWMDAEFGLMHARLQTWFPFSIQVCINGRSWLARQLDRAGLRYGRVDNCFPWLEDVEAAQALLDRLERTSWVPWLNRLASVINPALGAVLQGYRAAYYWSAYETEWATDVMFRSVRALQRIYPALTRGAMVAFSSRDVLRFLGKRLVGDFKLDVVSDYRQRPEGLRVKHRVGSNSLKMYDKQGSILRVETTINQPRDFQVYRPDLGKWARMRKGVADLHARAEASQRANTRYLEAISTLSTDTPVKAVVDRVCQPVRWHGRRMRALCPWSSNDRALLQALNRGEFALHGIRNRDMVRLLYHPRALQSPQARRRAAARVTRHIRLLRAHRILRKIPKQNRYAITAQGQKLVTAVLHYQNVTLEQLAKIAE